MKLSEHQPRRIMAWALALALTASSALAQTGTLTSGPDAVAWGADRFQVFARDNPGGLWHLWWDGGAWQGPENLGGGFLGSPAVATLNTNHLDVFVRGDDGALHHKWWDGGRWVDWERLAPAGSITSDPTAVAWGSDRIQVFARGNPDGLWHMWWDNTGWHGPENLGGWFIGSPAVAALNNERLNVFVRDYDGALQHKRWDGGRWAEWEQLAPRGAISSDPGVVAWGSWLQVFARGNPNGLWHLWWDGGAWNGPENLGGTFIDAPTVAALNTDQLDIFVRGENNALLRKRWAPGWTDWEQISPPVQIVTETTDPNTVVILDASNLIITQTTTPPPTQDYTIYQSGGITLGEARPAWHPTILSNGVVQMPSNLGKGFSQVASLLPDLMYFLIDMYNGTKFPANPELRKDRTVMLNALKNGDLETQAIMVLLMAQLAKSRVDSDPATWTADVAYFVKFLQALAQDQRQTAAILAQQAFDDWKVKDRAEKSVGLLALTYIPSEPPPEFLAMAKSGCAVSPELVPNFSRVIAGVTTIATVSILAGSLGGAAAFGAVSLGVGATAATGVGAMAVGAVAVPLLMVYVAVVKGIGLAEYDAYVKAMDAAIAAASDPVSVAQLKDLLSTTEGVANLLYWLAAQAATGTI